MITLRSARSSADASSLHPYSIGRSPAVELTSPSDMVGPSPVTSNGTETTDIEDDVVDEESEAPDGLSRSDTQVSHAFVYIPCSGANTFRSR
jgi:hypothetical protein